MAIHMEKDPNKGQGGNENKRREGGGGGGLGGLTKFLPAILFFLFKKPKLAIGILLVAAVFYFMSGGDLSSLIGDGGGGESQNSPLFMGADLDAAEYEKAMIYEPLAAGNNNQLPTKVSLLQYAPTRLNQGRQGSCVGWSSAYAARTILHAKATGQSPNSATFSPSYLYNQIALTGCQGAYINEAMKSMRSEGGLPFQEFKYDEGSCNREPNSSEISKGRTFRIKGYDRLSQNSNRSAVNSLAVKQNLAQGAPVVIGMMVGGTFMTGMYNKEVWNPSSSDYRQSGFGGHAMCVIGYDDNKSGGAFEIMNSWGESWGKKGVGWVKYSDFKEFVREAYGLYPMGSHNDAPPSKMKISFGLVDYQKQAFVALKKVEGNVFRSVRKAAAGDRFKVQVTNNVACYTYIFNEEADGVSNVLFPYDAKSSPYCGITGTRLFPKDESLVPDAVGTRDRIAVVITKEEIDYNEIKRRINEGRGDFANKVNSALRGQSVSNVTFQASDYITFEGDMKGGNAVAMIIEIDK
jgi:hypothetical protein